MVTEMIAILTAISFRLIGHFGQVQFVESRDRDVNLAFSRENYRQLADIHESNYIRKAWWWVDARRGMSPAMPPGGISVRRNGLGVLLRLYTRQVWCGRTLGGGVTVCMSAGRIPSQLKYQVEESWKDKVARL